MAAVPGISDCVLLATAVQESISWAAQPVLKVFKPLLSNLELQGTRLQFLRRKPTVLL